jgi:hypothetical protein
LASGYVTTLSFTVMAPVASAKVVYDGPALGEAPT